MTPAEGTPPVSRGSSATGAAACELCGDQDGLVLRARCHLTAPLALSLDGDELVVRCYLPSCGREVARFTLAEADPRRSNQEVTHGAAGERPGLGEEKEAERAATDQSMRARVSDVCLNEDGAPGRGGPVDSFTPGASPRFIETRWRHVVARWDGERLWMRVDHEPWSFVVAPLELVASGVQRPANPEPEALRADDYVRCWRREPSGVLAIGQVRDVGDGPTARIDWWTGPNARTCDWFPKDALVRIDAPTADEAQRPLGTCLVCWRPNLPSRAHCSDACFKVTVARERARTAEPERCAECESVVGPRYCRPCLMAAVEEAVDHYVTDDGRAHCQGCLIVEGSRKCPGMPRPETPEPAAHGPALDKDHPWADIVAAAVRYVDGVATQRELNDAVRAMQHAAYGLVPPPDEPEAFYFLRHAISLAKVKHPGGPDGMRSLAEEVGEVASAMRRESTVRVRAELMDVAVVALRWWEQLAAVDVKSTATALGHTDAARVARAYGGKEQP